ncbi:MAG: BglII/BstYI family type II restriction endonuclease [Microgenomates group bacterium]
MKTTSAKFDFSDLIIEKYEIYNYRHASTILRSDFPTEYAQLTELLENFDLTREDIQAQGGRKSPIASKFDAKLYSTGWEEKLWNISLEIDGKKNPFPTHHVDYYKNRIAVELEWNNKDTFFDRDLNNFRLLHQLGIISVGIIVTRSDKLQKVFNTLGKGKSYGTSTTHTGKLLPKIVGGGSAECPVLVFGISEACVKK